MACCLPPDSLTAAKARQRFPYKRNIEQMAATPADWPAPTADISEIEIEVRFVPAGAAGFVLRRIGSGVATLKLKIIDYPGEWLLDLPLLTQSYADWSRSTLHLCRQGIRATTAREFISLLSRHRHDNKASDDDARRAHELYRLHLRTARQEHGLTFCSQDASLARVHQGRIPTCGSRHSIFRMGFGARPKIA